MTGVIERLRSWLRSVFGDETDPDATETVDGTTTTSPDRQVVHRDDRPLETPGTMGADRETAIGVDAETGERRRVTGADAGTSQRRRTTGTGTGGEEAGEPVSIPDAEAVADGDDAALRTSDAAGSGIAREGPDAGATGGVDGGGRREDAGRTDAGAGEADGNDADDRADAGDGEFACAVCGTAVDDPGAPCPLCRSSDVVPVSDARESSGPVPARGGRTTVAPADDEEAVDRLRDLGAGSGRDG